MDMNWKVASLLVLKLLLYRRYVRGKCKGLKNEFLGGFYVCWYTILAKARIFSEIVG